MAMMTIIIIIIHKLNPEAKGFKSVVVENTLPALDKLLTEFGLGEYNSHKPEFTPRNQSLSPVPIAQLPDMQSDSQQPSHPSPPVGRNARLDEAALKSSSSQILLNAISQQAQLSGERFQMKDSGYLLFMWWD